MGFADNKKIIEKIINAGEGNSVDLLKDFSSPLRKYPEKLVKYGNQCLEFALDSDDRKLFEELLKIGASTEQHVDHIPIFHFCIREYETYVPFVRLLIKYGVDINSINRYDETALDIIEGLDYASQATLSAKEILLENGAKRRLELENEN